MRGSCDSQNEVSRSCSSVDRAVKTDLGDRPLGLVAGEPPRHRPGDVGVVVLGIEAVGAGVYDLVAQGPEQIDQWRLQDVSGVVRPDRDAQTVTS